MTSNDEYLHYEEEMVAWRTVALASYCLRNPGFADSAKIDPQGFKGFLR